MKLDRPWWFSDYVALVFWPLVVALLIGFAFTTGRHVGYAAGVEAAVCAAVPAPQGNER